MSLFIYFHVLLSSFVCTHSSPGLALPGWQSWGCSEPDFGRFVFLLGSAATDRGSCPCPAPSLSQPSWSVPSTSPACPEPRLAPRQGQQHRQPPPALPCIAESIQASGKQLMLPFCTSALLARACSSSLCFPFNLLPVELLSPSWDEFSCSILYPLSGG